MIKQDGTIARDIDKESAWKKKQCPAFGRPCFGSGCGDWVETRIEDGEKYGVCIKG